MPYLSAESGRSQYKVAVSQMQCVKLQRLRVPPLADELAMLGAFVVQGRVCEPAAREGGVDVEDQFDVGAVRQFKDSFLRFPF